MQLKKSGATLGGRWRVAPPLSLHRRATTLALWCVLLANATTLHAQQPVRMFRMGLLVPASAQAAPFPTAILKRLEETGIRRRTEPPHRAEIFRGTVGTLQRAGRRTRAREPGMVVAVSTTAALAAKQATQNSPVVMLRADGVIR